MSKRKLLIEDGPAEKIQKAINTTSATTNDILTFYF